MIYPTDRLRWILIGVLPLPLRNQAYQVPRYNKQKSLLRALSNILSTCPGGVILIFGFLWAQSRGLRWKYTFVMMEMNKTITMTTWRLGAEDWEQKKH